MPVDRFDVCEEFDRSPFDTFCATGNTLLALEGGGGLVLGFVFNFDIIWDK